MSAASIVLTDLAWAAPGATPLFSNLDIAFGRERAGIVGRNGVGKTTLLRLIAGELKPSQGAVTVRGRLGLLRQTLRAAPDDTVADLFGVREALAVLDRAAAGAATADDLAAADWTLESRMAAALAQTGLGVDAHVRLATLSGGQRTRAGLAALMFARPDFLLLDEPTNNLDRAGRIGVIDLLAGWSAGALVVSHDRELLEGMDAIVELTPFEISRFGGGWSAYRDLKSMALAAVERDVVEAERRAEDLARASQIQAERQQRRNAAGQRKASKGDMPKILLGARKARAQETGAAQERLAERRLSETQAAAAAARERLEVVAPINVAAASTGLAAGRTVLRIDGVSAGYDPGRPVLSDLSLTVTGPERIAITGPNGTGKSTLLKVIAGALAPLSGEAMRAVPLVLLDQDFVLLDADASILDNFRRLHPQADENACRAALARFRFRANAALQTVASLSGGQRIRATLACVLGARPPPLLILDEPTNHLDLESIEAMEAGLAAYDGALLVVSHDEAFLTAIGITRRLDLGLGQGSPS